MDDLIGISADPLDNPVNLKDLARMAEYLSKWEELSPELGLTLQHITNIHKPFIDYGDQKREALQKWREIKGHAATYRTFIAAATAVSNMELVDNVKAMIGIQVQPTGIYTTKYFFGLQAFYYAYMYTCDVWLQTSLFSEQHVQHTNYNYNVEQFLQKKSDTHVK